jgi:pimeloyl-ACP methyl ester carboxylesterase
MVRQRIAVLSKKHIMATPSKSVPGEVSIPRVSFRTVEADGLGIFYREAGPADGPVVLLLHGFPSSSHMFRELSPRLATRYRVMAPDLPGFGFTRVPEERDYNINIRSMRWRAPWKHL